MWSLRRKRTGAGAAKQSVALAGCFIAGSIATGVIAVFVPLRSSQEPNASRAVRTEDHPATARQLDLTRADGASAAPASADPTVGSEFEPVLHARKAGIKTCLGNVVAQSRRVIDTRHSALSIWNTREPDSGLFQSILALKYDNKNAPNGAAILTAAPDGASHCGGSFVQIYPTALSCSTIQADLARNGKTVAELLDLPVISTADGRREILLPSAGGGCVIVAASLN